MWASLKWLRDSNGAGPLVSKVLELTDAVWQKKRPTHLALVPQLICSLRGATS
jgi:hypothetical protein